jgi:hypothetical protein
LCPGKYAASSTSPSCLACDAGRSTKVCASTSNSSLVHKTITIRTSFPLVPLTMHPSPCLFFIRVSTAQPIARRALWVPSARLAPANAASAAQASSQTTPQASLRAARAMRARLV